MRQAAGLANRMRLSVGGRLGDQAVAFLRRQYATRRAQPHAQLFGVERLAEEIVHPGFERLNQVASGVERRQQQNVHVAVLA